MLSDFQKLTLVNQRSPEIIGKLAVKDTVLNKFRAHTGYNPGKVSIRLYEGGGDLGECCEEMETSGKFTEVEAELDCIKSENCFCEIDLARALNDFKFRFTAGSEEMDGRLYQLFTEQELAKISLHIDRLIWQGDKSSPDGNLNKINGLLKTGEANVPAENQISITSGNPFTAIRQIIDSIPLSVWDQSSSVDMFMGVDMAKSIQGTLLYLNLNHYNPGQVTDVYAEFSFPGYGNIRIVPTRGLNGTGKVVVTPRINIHWLTNLTEDHMTMKWWYSEDKEKYCNRLRFLLGVTFGIYENVLLVDIDESVLTNVPGLPVDIVSPLGASGGVLTETAA